MRKALLLLAATVVLAAALGFSLEVTGASSGWFAFLVVWLPMTWLGTVSRLAVPRLPERVHTLRPWERSGRVYEVVGVRLVKRLLRRGPMAVFNPHLHLPAERTPANLARLEQRMRDAEASHLILLVLTLGVVAHALARGWWTAAIWTAVFAVLLNGYPVMLQRYNRAVLRQRFGDALDHSSRY